MKWIIQVNEMIARRVTLAFGSMGMTYLFLLWSLLPLLYPPSQNLVFYTSSGVIQLVALPLLMVGQVVLGRAAEQRAQSDHETLMAEFTEIKSMHEEQAKELKELRIIHHDLYERHNQMVAHLEQLLDTQEAQDTPEES